MHLPTITRIIKLEKPRTNGRFRMDVALENDPLGRDTLTLTARAYNAKSTLLQNIHGWLFLLPCNVIASHTLLAEYLDNLVTVNEKRMPRWFARGLQVVDLRETLHAAHNGPRPFVRKIVTMPKTPMMLSNASMPVDMSRDPAHANTPSESPFYAGGLDDLMCHLWDEGQLDMPFESPYRAIDPFAGGAGEAEMVLEISVQYQMAKALSGRVPIPEGHVRVFMDAGRTLKAFGPDSGKAALALYGDIDARMTDEQRNALFLAFKHGDAISVDIRVVDEDEVRLETAWENDDGIIIADAFEGLTQPDCPTRPA